MDGWQDPTFVPNSHHKPHTRPGPPRHSHNHEGMRRHGRHHGKGKGKGKWRPHKPHHKRGHHYRRPHNSGQAEKIDTHRKPEEMIKGLQKSLKSLLSTIRYKHEETSSVKFEIPNPVPEMPESPQVKEAAVFEVSEIPESSQFEEAAVPELPEMPEFPQVEEAAVPELPEAPVDNSEVEDFENEDLPPIENDIQTAPSLVDLPEAKEVVVTGRIRD